MQKNVGGVVIYMYTHLLRSSQQKLFGMGRKTLQIRLKFVYYQWGFSSVCFLFSAPFFLFTALNLISVKFFLLNLLARKTQVNAWWPFSHTRSSIPGSKRDYNRSPPLVTMGSSIKRQQMLQVSIFNEAVALQAFARLALSSCKIPRQCCIIWTRRNDFEILTIPQSYMWPDAAYREHCRQTIPAIESMKQFEIHPS